MKVIAEIGNPNYYENRAIEAIVTSQTAFSPHEQLNQLRQAIGLLLLSLVQRGQNPKDLPSGSRDSGEDRKQADLG